MKKNSIILIGYSGHAFVAYSIFNSAGLKVTGYCDQIEKELNPFSLSYHGSENGAEGLTALQQNDFFISVGDNLIRKKIYFDLVQKKLFPVNAIHASSIIDPSSQINSNGIMISAGVCINPLAKIGNGVILNTGCIIEHECSIGDFAHIAPGSVLCGNVNVGQNSFIGANTVVRENISIGKNVMVGAGSVIVKDIPDNAKVMGNPARII